MNKNILNIQTKYLENQSSITSGLERFVFYQITRITLNLSYIELAMVLPIF